jgi:quercetin dioxygenase-like cupin family protein
MKITRLDDVQSQQGPADWFTGSVWLQPVTAGEPPSSLAAYRVTFAPQARTAWHTHPLGQSLYILAGRARIGRADGTVEELSPGDSVRFEPGERHWHGAAPGGVMSHLAIQETGDDGTTADWAEHVSDEQYGA